MLKLQLKCGYSKNLRRLNALFGAPHHIMDENLHPLVQWWNKPRDCELFSSKKELFFSLKIFLVLHFPLDKIRANYPAVTNEAFDLG